MRWIELAARALCRADGNPENTRFEGRPMWESYVPQARAVLEAVQYDALVAALAPFALAMEHHGPTRAIDEAFIWESERRPMVSYGALRQAHALVTKVAPSILDIARKSN